MAIGKISTNTRIALSLGDSWASCWLLLCLVRMSQHLLSLFLDVIVNFMPSVLWHCWLGGRKCIRPVKNWAVGCWCGYLSGARWRLAYGPADATATHCLSKIQICFAFLVSAHLGSPGQRAIQRVCVCVYLSTLTDDLNFGTWPKLGQNEPLCDTDSWFYGAHWQPEWLNYWINSTIIQLDRQCKID